MSTEEDLSRLKLIIDRMDTEATLHWSRNSYFLVVMSMLFLAFGQKPVEDLLTLTVLRALISILGVTLGLIWLLIQHRSSSYINHYETEARKLAEVTNTPDLYPEKLGGIEMRKLAYALPVVFIIIWLVFLVMVLASYN